MYIRNFIILLTLFFSQLLLADDLNDYKYENYKASAVEVSFNSILLKMRAEMYDGKEISGLIYKPDGKKLLRLNEVRMLLVRLNILYNRILLKKIKLV